jgi:hypothetical protein
MKLITLTTKRDHERSDLDEPRSGVLHQARTYTELRQQIHYDLRMQHPEWIQATGECPMCDAYEGRLMELLGPLAGKGDNEPVAAADPTLAHGLN